MINASYQVTNCKVALDDQNFIWFIVYASNDCGHKGRLWEMISQIASIVEGPCLIHGYFCFILSNQERVDGLEIDSFNEGFKECIEEAVLMELKN